MYQAIVGRSRPLFNTFRQRLQTTDPSQRRKHIVRSDTYKTPGPIPLASLRVQGPAWATAGGAFPPSSILFPRFIGITDEVKMASAVRTVLAFQHDAKLYTSQTIVTAIYSFMALEESNQQLFKQGTDADHAIVTEQTIFHPQGGGQPSDEGKITGPLGGVFTVAAVRMDTVRRGQVLHFGRFNDKPAIFAKGDTVVQAIDIGKRVFYSRLHTAGHVLGSAVKDLLAKEVEGFQELKASHFPESAACEFQGLVDGKWREPIQRKVDELIAAKLPVQVEWWDEEEFRRRGMERLIPDQSLIAPGEKFRVIHIVGAEVYPCGGTHVDTTDQCGTTTIRKITRKTGNSKISYTVVE